MIPASPGYRETAGLARPPQGQAVENARLPAAVWRRQIEAELRLRERFAQSDPRSRVRIAAPDSVQTLWRQHKYAVLARDERGYRQTGPAVAQGTIGFDALADWLERRLVQPPSPGGLRNAIEHMWGHVSERAGASRAALGGDPVRLLGEIGREAVRQDNRYLLEQVALSELLGWHDE